jgi:tRNASer (uridine44-2'-O)-methyltransferase
MSEKKSVNFNTSTSAEKYVEQNPQPSSGDLRSLRATKDEQKTERGFGNSMIGSLIAKTRDIAEEVKFEVEETYLQTPGAFSRALIGRKQQAEESAKTSPGQSTQSALVDKVTKIIERECAKDGGVQAAAKLWIEQAKSLHRQQGQ